MTKSKVSEVLEWDHIEDVLKVKNSRRVDGKKKPTTKNQIIFPHLGNFNETLLMDFV